MTINEIYDYYGKNWSRAMQDLRVGVNSYQYWMKVGYIPIATQIKIERRSKGLFKAEIKHGYKEQEE